jgi:hypothetical protein
VKDEHVFCRGLWREAKDAALIAGVTLPVKMTAMRSSTGQYFVQGLKDSGEYIRACCAFDAKAKRIHSLINKP